MKPDICPEIRGIVTDMKINIPPFIKAGSCIGVTAPSFGCTIEPYISKFAAAKKIIEGKGYSVKAGDTVYKSDGLGISTDPETCARELESFYLDDSISAIISAGGGEMMCETAACMDFEKLKGKAKWFMGYSDNTNFIFPLVTICHTAAIYGPCISGFGKKWEQSEKDAFGLLEGRVKSVKGYEKFQLPQDDIAPEKDFENFTYNLTAEKVLSVFTGGTGSTLQKNCSNKVSMDGILLGGCLDVLALLCGTKLDHVKEFMECLGNKKIIWVLESCDGNPMEIRRQIWHLKNASWFSNTAGFLIGRPLASFGQEMMGVNQYNAVTDILKDLNVPVVMDCDIGHIDPAMPLVMGADTHVEVKGNNIEINFDI